MKLNLFSFFPYAAPLALAIVAAMAGLEPGIRVRRVLQAARIATLFALGIAIGSIAFVAFDEPTTSPLIGAGGVGFAVRLDMLSAVMFTLVSFVAFIGIVWWAWGRGRRGRFDEAARLPFADEEMQRRTLERERINDEGREEGDRG